MAYVKIDHGILASERVWALQDRYEEPVAAAALGMWAMGQVWTSANNRDGKVAVKAVSMWGGEEALDALEAVGLIERISPMWFEIVDYLKFNRSAAEIEAISEKRSASGRLGGRPKQAETVRFDDEKANSKQTETVCLSPAKANSKPAVSVSVSVSESVSDLRSEIPDQDLTGTPGDTPPSAAEARVFDHWVSAFGLDPKRTKLDRKRRTKLRARLKRFTADELCAALDSFAASPWRRAERVRHEFATLLRDDAQVENASGDGAARIAWAEAGPDNVWDTSDIDAERGAA